ncbi:hypothetical protein ZIOFF_060210 [Zingiber officinale]|uniref:PH domain-containing protein n=1 Tax=Zingiber officinale TaxID=94328 RepID=A0A8J5FAH3_ZINOF|nr:hypothetical protein ZIOFF_060210 [Zingiber officinale]
MMASIYPLPFPCYFGDLGHLVALDESMRNPYPNRFFCLLNILVFVSEIILIADYSIFSLMDDIYGKIDVFPEHFQPIKASESSLQGSNSRDDHKLRSQSHSWTVRRVIGAASLLNLFSLPRLRWGSGEDDEKVELTRAELESLQSEIVDAEDREMHLKAQLQYLDSKFTPSRPVSDIETPTLTSELEHVDGILRSARLCGYLYVRTRWTQLPGEPPIIDDDDIDDWLPRFVILHGSSIYYYVRSFDMSPQDTTNLSEIVEMGPLPSFIDEDKETRYAFYLLTNQGLRFECSSISRGQVESWLSTLGTDCKLESGSTL